MTRIDPVAFHQYAFSDYLDNVVRGSLGEFIVAEALGVTDTPFSSWESWDIDYKGLKIEVKTSAFWQTWKQDKPTRPVFGIPKKRGWKGESNEWDNEVKRHADVYVFCLYAEKELSNARENVLNTAYWEFFVVPTNQLPDQKTISLNPLRELTKPIGFEELKSAIKFFEGV